MTIDIPAVWSSAGGRWQTPDGRFFFDTEAADRACDFFPDLIRHHIGEFAGQPFTLMEYQAKLLTRPLFGWKRAHDGWRRFRKVFAFIPKGGGKALALDTPIPTPSGWTTMREISAGDFVIGEDGHPVRVIAVSDVMVNRPCYRVAFDNGSSIVADEGHLWATEQRYYGNANEARRLARERGVNASWKYGIRTTSEIASSLRYSNGLYKSVNHSITLAKPLDLPSVELPIEPYTLGVWLGDGDSDCARITMGREDLEQTITHLAATGTDVSTVRQTNGGFRARIGSVGATGPAGSLSINAALRTNGLLHNKHVPKIYLRASFAQRLALLQGLMDSDGSIDRKGRCEFSVTVLALCECVHALIISLGIKAVMRQSDAKLNGRVVGKRWRISFQPDPEVPVFRLGRKLARQRWYHSRRRLSGDHRIVGCESIESVPVKCITVESLSGLYLAGESMVPTHNSPWAAATGVYLARCDGEAAAEVYALANDRSQARTVHTNAKYMVEDAPLLADGAEILKDSIYWLGSRSTYVVLSSDASSAHGKRPHGLIFDELHGFSGDRDRELFEALKKSLIKRRQPVLLMITHSGTDDEGICREEYEYATYVLSGTIPDDTHLPVIFEAKKGDDWTSPEVHARVNPGYGITVKADAVEVECLEAKSEPRKQNDFKRYNLNIWVNQATAWIPVEWWDACEGPLDDAELVTLECGGGLDLAQKWDLACFNVVFRRYLSETKQLDVLVEDQSGEVAMRTISLNYELFVRPHFWIPDETMRQHETEDKVPYSIWEQAGLVTATDGSVIDYDRIYRDITTKIVPRYPKLKQGMIGYDPAFATDIATKLRDVGGLQVIEVLQNYKMISEPSQVVEALIKGKRLHHDGHRVLRNHWENAAIKTDDAGRIRPVKPRNPSKRMDGAIALIMGQKALSLMTPPKRYGAFVV